MSFMENSWRSEADCVHSCAAPLVNELYFKTFRHGFVFLMKIWVLEGFEKEIFINQNLEYCWKLMFFFQKYIISYTVQEGDRQ